MTPRQVQFVRFLREWPHEHAPSWEEIRQALGLRSKSGVSRMVHALEAQGIIERRAYKARSIRLKPPGSTPGLSRFETADLVEELMARGYAVSKIGAAG